MKVDIPFMEAFRDKMLTGKKTCTARNKRYGKVGDTFDKFGTSFVLTRIEKLPLRMVSLHLYAPEGLESPEQFIATWNLLHPKKRYQAAQQVLVHFFEFTPNKKGEESE